MLRECLAKSTPYIADLSTTKGSPMAKYAVGTHDIGDFFFVLFIAKFLFYTFLMWKSIRQSAP